LYRSPLRKVDSSNDNQEIQILWNQKLLYGLHNSSPFTIKFIIFLYQTFFFWSIIANINKDRQEKCKVVSLRSKRALEIRIHIWTHSSLQYERELSVGHHVTAILSCGIYSVHIKLDPGWEIQPIIRHLWQQERMSCFC